MKKCQTRLLILFILTSSFIPLRMLGAETAADSMMRAAAVLFNEGRCDKAIAVYHKVLPVYRENQNIDGMSKTIAMLARCHEQISLHGVRCTFDVSAPLEQKDVNFRIDSIVMRRPDTVIALIRWGSCDGLVANGKGVVRGLFMQDAPGRNDTVYAGGEVVEVHERSAFVALTRKDNAPLAGVREGDLLCLPTRIPVKSFRSIIFKLAALNIGFHTSRFFAPPITNDGSYQIQYQLRQVLEDDSRDFENDVLDVMAFDIHDTAKDLDLPDTIRGGRFAGCTLKQAMLKATRRDVRAFLHFVLSFPGKYMGHDWRADETYYTWLSINSLWGSDDVRDTLMALPDDRDHRTALDSLRVEFGAAKGYAAFISDWNATALEWATLGNGAEALRLNTIARNAAEADRDSASLAWVSFSRSQIMEALRRYEEAIACYRSAWDLFDKIHSPNGGSYCANNIASVFICLGRYRDALAVCDSALQLKQLAARTDSSDQLKVSIGNSLLEKGRSLYLLGRFNEALEAYVGANRFFDEGNNHYDASTKAWESALLAEVYDKVGDFTRSLDCYMKVLQLREGLSDRSGEVDALESLGYENSRLGRYREALEYYSRTYDLAVVLNDKKNAARARSNIGQMLWSLGQYDSAIVAHREAIRMRGEIRDTSGLAYSWSKLAELYKVSGDPQKGIAAYRQVIDLYSSLGVKPDIARAYVDLGSLYEDVKDVEQALNNLRVALHIWHEMGSVSDSASVMYTMSCILYGANNYTDARTYAQQAKTIQEATGDKPGLINSLSMLGLIAQAYDFDANAADTLYRASLKLAEETGSSASISFCYRRLGGLASGRGNNAEALEYYEKAFKISNDGGDKVEASSLLLDIGGCSFEKGEFTAALNCYERSLALADSVNSRGNISSAMLMIGEIHQRLGEFQNALAMQKKAYALAMEVSDPWRIANADLGMGNTCNMMGEFKEAIAFYHAVDSIYRSKGSNLSRATPLNNLGTIYFRQGNYDRALQYFHEALEMLERMHWEGEFLPLVESNIGEVLCDQGKYAESAEWLHHALQIARKKDMRRETFSIIGILGKLELAQDHVDTARGCLLEAYRATMASGEKDQRAEFAGELGKLYHTQRNDTAALRYLTESIGIARAIGSTRQLWEPLYTLSQVYRDQGKKREATASLKEAVDVLESIRGKIAGDASERKLFSTGKTKAQMYETLIELLKEAGDAEGAFNYLQRSVNYGFEDQLRSLPVSTPDDATGQALAREREMKGTIEALQQRAVSERSKPDAQQDAGLIDSLHVRQSIAEREYTVFLNNAISRQPGLAEYFTGGINPDELRESRDDIPADAAVVAYLTGEQELYIFVATTDSVGIEVVRIGKGRLESRITALYNVLSNRPSRRRRGVTTDEPPAADTSLLAGLSSELYATFIAPIEQRIAGKKKLAIIPYGDLSYLPFQVLGTMQDGVMHYLIDRWSVFYLTRMKALTSNKTKAAIMKVAAFGNADNSLPQAETEVAEIKTLYADASVFVGRDATKDRVMKLPVGFNTLHFATHGMLDYANIANSYLVLAPSSDGLVNGRLTINEVLGMTNLHGFQLVTLSACNTAIGADLVKGWVINPANAFLSAGAKAVVASLWQVDDEATGILMKEFYTNLKSMPTIDALRAAQQVLLRDPRRCDPYFWAPFVLIGDWK